MLRFQYRSFRAGIGLVLALAALVGLILSHESFLLVILIPAGILACSLFRLEPSEEGKFTPQWNTMCTISFDILNISLYFQSR